MNLTKKFSASLTPTPLAAVAATHKDRKNDGIKFKEKRLSAKIWRCKGVHQNGSHFPLCVFTNNVGRRSPNKLEERRQQTKAEPMARFAVVARNTNAETRLARTSAMAGETAARLARRCRSAARSAVPNEK